MVRFLLLAVMVFLVFSSCKIGGLDVKEWKTFTSEKGRFEADFISKPSESSDRVSTRSGSVKGYVFTTNSRFPSVLFQVAYADLPLEPIFEEEVLKDKYDLVRDSFVNSEGTELVRESDIRLDGKLGREMTIREGIRVSKHRLFLVGNRQYLITVRSDHFSEKDENINEAANKFLDSFKLVAEK